MKKSLIVILIIVVSFVVGFGVGKIFSTEEEVNDLTKDWKIFDSAEYSFKYPENYIVTDYDEKNGPLNIAYIVGPNDRKIELHRGTNIHVDRPFGFEEGTEEEVTRYADIGIPKDTYVLGQYGDALDVWYFYSKDDSGAVAELDQIKDSIVVK